MKVIFTCGGTAGHVNPALALAGYMREKDAGTQILFVGAERGLERDLIAHTDYPFRTVNISSFHRSFKPAEIRHNLVSLKNLAHAEREANAILKDFRPDLIVISAGFDAHWRDPLADINLREADFAWATSRLMEIAERRCGGRIVSVLEGGYDLQALTLSTAAHVGALMGG